jgi:EmrB/QacA subfamily drug resistance transporter
MRALLQGLDYKWQVVMVLAMGTFMVVLDTTIVNIALPRIITIFGSSVDQAQLILTGYMLALATIMPATAFLGGRVGTKRLYLVTVAFFTIGSALCGLAWSVPSLVVARVIQGLGGGMIQPLGMAVLFRVTPPEQRGAVLGVYTLPVMVGPVLGPTLGGYLVEYVDWRWVFFLNLPVGILVVLLGLLLLRETPISRGIPFDRLGFVLAAVFSGAALLALADAEREGWTDPGIVLKFLLAAVALPLFIWWQLRARHPLLNLRLFAIPAFALGAVVNFVASAALFGALFLLPVFLQNLRGMGAMETGLLLLPQAVASGISVPLSGRLYDRLGPRPLILTGLPILALATWWLARLDITTPDSTIRLILLLRGASMGMVMMPAITAWMAAAPPSQMPAASALSNVMRQLFGAFATAIFASVLNARIGYHTATLSMVVQPDLPGVARALGLGQQVALAHGLSLAEAKVLVVAQLAGHVRLAAAVRGFDDCFLVAAVVCLAGVVPALFVRGAPRGGARPGKAAAVD